MFIKKIIPFVLVTVISFSTIANTTNPDEDKKETTKNATVQETIVGVAVGNENFSTLVAAVKAAGLVDVLNSDGPFTVFAPTNAAFAKLPEGTITTLLKSENKELLTAILTYHVVAGKFVAKDVLKAIKDNKGKIEIKTVQGNTLTASLKGGKVILTDAKGNVSTVVMTDVAASNGVIHAIDTVVMPK
ncbi:fasciclin domain-containing protein [Polaribacter gangjinensis]|uniref:Beta-Ig-H3/fasciclin n=1 Tax=Polaribacter gangjinensis TaxID=574710 RepID=A0A2S7WAT6_9FLAO|nr:fasciclin domain-containing protein [Polaribacter gangjinensis]PQJ74713.1 beta-Ig-H3/fasciclin [Polaribacter gangjinensis]